LQRIEPYRVLELDTKSESQRQTVMLRSDTPRLNSNMANSYCKIVNQLILIVKTEGSDSD